MKHRLYQLTRRLVARWFNLALSAKYVAVMNCYIRAGSYSYGEGAAENAYHNIVMTGDGHVDMGELTDRLAEAGIAFLHDVVVEVHGQDLAIRGRRQP